MAWSFEQSPELHKDLCENLPQDDSHVHRLLGGKEPEAAERLHQSWRSSAVGRQIDQVLSGTAVEHASAQGYTQQNGSQTRGASDEVSLSVRPSKLRLPQNAWILLDFYFAFVHSWMPMTEKASMMKLIYAYPVDGIPIEQATHAEHAELWGIMAVASFQVDSPMADDQAESLRVRNIAELLLPTSQTYEVPHLKAMILLTLIDMSAERTLDAWMRIGTVVRLLSLFKLLEHLDGTTRWCQHVHLAAFVLESALALRLNARGHLTPAYIENIGYINEDGRDEWDPWQDPLATSVNVSRAPARSFSTLNKLVKDHKLHCGDGLKQSDPADLITSPTIVFDLLRNACLAEGRLQPAIILNGVRKSGNSLPSNLFDDVQPETMSPAWSAPSQQAAQSSVQHHYPYMNVPNDLAEMPPSTIAPTALDGANSVGGGDIFQELALLERTDSSNQFMQNLGFAPDLDLQEFFGSDYQASDPMLALMHLTPNYGGPGTT